MAVAVLVGAGLALGSGVALGNQLVLVARGVRVNKQFEQEELHSKLGVTVPQLCGNSWLHS